MGKILFGIIAVAATVMMVDSLSCNKCNYGLFGFCFFSQTVTCGTNITSCFTGKATFPAISSNFGFNTQGCVDNTTNCNTTITGTLLSVPYNTQTTCCSTNNCNPVQTSGAPSTKMTLTGAAFAAVLASVMGSML